MRIKDYIEERKCTKSLAFQHMEPEDMSGILLARFFTELSDIVKDEAANRIITRDILGKIRIRVDAEYALMLSQFQAAWYGGEERRLAEHRELMNTFYKRFMDAFFMEYLLDTKVVSANQKHMLTVEEGGKVLYLEDTTHLILQKAGGYAALVFNGGKNFEKRSLNGKTPLTKVESDMRYAFLKVTLEEEYQGINIVSVFFQEGEKKGMVLDWVSNGTQQSNVFVMSFTGCYEDGKLDEELCLSNAESSLILYSQKGQTEKCRYCMHRPDCQMQTYSERRPAEKQQRDWSLPKYDEAQKQFVEFKEGEILVCAGPGSGKTASLVGRVCALAESGVPTERILLISYTEKAAGEIESRLFSKFSEDEMPRIGTLHSIAAEVERFYSRMYNLKPHKPLTDAKEKKLVKKVLDSYDRLLTGVDYRCYIKGRYSTVSVVFNGLKQLKKNPEKFFLKHSDYVEEEWRQLESDLEKFKEKGNYITYDEMITNACKILKKEQSIARYYHQKYEYIMVDEYQDINKEQEELIAILSQGNNLACIGDDDQAIYGFKGCSSAFMRAFLERHPHASMAKMQRNYRSTKNIVQFTNSILMGMDKSQRIGKIVEYSDYAVEGEKPALYADNDPETVDMLINKALKKGYCYDDIAVIATTNETLSALSDNLSAPTELASAYVINDFLFHVILNCVAVITGADSSVNPLIRLGLLFEKDEKWMSEAALRRKQNDEISELLDFARKMSDETPEHFVARLSAYLDMDESVSDKAMLDIAVNSEAETLEEFYQVLADMKLYEDNKKLEYPIHGRVTLITAHSCKGMEWPVVIVYDTEHFSGNVSENTDDSMDARLFYVAASRAKQSLVFLKREGSETIIDDNPLVEKKNERAVS